MTVADINQEMLDVGARRALERGERETDGSLVFTRQNAETVDFPANTFDAYTIVFGIRNVTDKDAALAEAHRVLRGGRALLLHGVFDHRLGGLSRSVRPVYSDQVLPRMGQAIAGDAASYRYLVESIRRFPDMATFERMIGAAGFENTRAEAILGGAVAIHSGWKV